MTTTTKTTKRLQDKNGIKIYRGDLVERNDGERGWVVSVPGDGLFAHGRVDDEEVTVRWRDATDGVFVRADDIAVVTD